MKILYLCSDPGIDLSAPTGSSIHVRSLVRALADLGHQVTVVCSSISDAASIEDLQATVRACPLAEWNRTIARGIREANRLAGRTARHHPDLVRALHNLTFATTARAVARERSPDMIYERYSLWGIAGAWLAKHRSIPLVLEVNAPLTYEQQRFRGLTCPTLARRIEHGLWRGATLLVTVSEWLCKHVRETGVAAERVHILPNAVNASRFRADVNGERVRKLFKLDGYFVLGFVGTFKPWHGVDFLLDAFQVLHQGDPATHLLLAGDGPLRRSLQDEVKKRGLQEAVTFTGAVAHTEMPDYLGAMNVAVAPYPALGEFYYSPLKLFEYMATGRAIVASRVGQVEQVIVDGVTGLLFDPGDLAGLLGCLRRSRHDVTLRLGLGERASAACRDHSWRNNGLEVMHWVEDLISQTSAVTLHKEERKIV